jgi:hypothetical protein
LPFYRKPISFLYSSFCNVHFSPKFVCELFTDVHMQDGAYVELQKTQRYVTALDPK